MVLVYQTVFVIVPLRIAIQNSILRWFSPGLAILGFALALLSIREDPGRYRVQELRIPWMLILVLILSTVVNHDRGLRPNINTIIWQANLILFVFSSCVQIGKNASELKIRADSRLSVHAAIAFRHSVLFLLLVIDIAVAWSLVQYFHLYFHLLMTHDDLYHLGLFEGRLFGIFTTPYCAALVNFFAVAGSVIYAISSEGMIKLFLIVSCFLSTTMIILSATRSVMLGILLSIAVIVTMIQINRFPAELGSKKRLLKGILAALLALCVSAGVYLIQVGYSRALQDVAAGLNRERLVTAAENDSTTENKIRSDIARKDTSGNVASNRFGIWLDYAQVLIDRPEKLILGYSPCGYMEYISDHYPDIFIVKYFKEKYPFYYNKHKIYDTHNTILTVLISTGLSGLLLLAALAVKTLRLILERYRKGYFKAVDYCAFAVLITTVTAMMFESDVFYQCNITSVVFWMIIGFLSGRYHDEKKGASNNEL